MQDHELQSHSHNRAMCISFQRTRTPTRMRLISTLNPLPNHCLETVSTALTSNSVRREVGLCLSHCAGCFSLKLSPKRSSCAPIRSHDSPIHQPLRLSAVEMPLPRRHKDVSIVLVLYDDVRQEIPEFGHVLVAPQNQDRLPALRFTIKMNPRDAAKSCCNRLDLLKCESFLAKEPLEKFRCPALLPLGFLLARARHGIPALALTVSASRRGSLRRCSGDLRGSDGPRCAGPGICRGSRENEPAFGNHDKFVLVPLTMSPARKF